MPDYDSLLETAASWVDLGSCLLRAREWEPSKDDQHLAYDVVHGATSPTIEAPPHEDAPMWWRTARLASWAPVIRLALRADGFSETPSGVDVPRILASVYPLAAALEDWHHDPSEANKHLISDAERFVGELVLLLTAVASGDAEG